MDWWQAIGKNQEALKRVLIMLITMADLGGLRLATDAGLAYRPASRPSALPRHMRRLLLRLLRPTAAAIRRLFVIATCGLAETFRAPRKRNSHPGFIRADIGPGTNNDMLRARDSPLCRRQTPVHIAARNHLT